ncbi:MAG: ATP synthase F0 subunit B [Spirochaetaceae bacterium]|nr:ATP synthase F0 subunit B [Spirochaetaceae bacterium]|tara:strand:- start:76101 stop:76628 length:528 start_codon:yes stop_codon:yes gene_type:complete
MLEFIAAEGGISLLEVNPGLAIWTTVTFLLVLFILQKFAWKPITSALDERANKIHEDLDRAERIRTDAESKLEEYMEKLNGLKEEGQDIIAEARKDAEGLRNEILETARQEAEQIRERSRKEIDLAMDAALDKLHKDVTGLSVQIASQILGKTLSEQDHKELVEQSIKSIKSLQN